MIHICGAAIYPREPTQNKGTFKRICGGVILDATGKQGRMASQRDGASMAKSYLLYVVVGYSSSNVYQPVYQKSNLSPLTKVKLV